MADATHGRVVEVGIPVEPADGNEPEVFSGGESHLARLIETVGLVLPFVDEPLDQIVPLGPAGGQQGTYVDRQTDQLLEIWHYLQIV